MKEGFVLMNLPKHKRLRAIQKGIRLMQQKSMERWRASIHRVITKKEVKNGQIKTKQTCSLCFVSVFKFHENKFKIVQKISRK